MKTDRQVSLLCHGVLALFLGLLVLVPLSAQGILRAPQVLKTEFQNVPPKFIREADGTYRGISWEIMKLLEHRSAVRFLWPLDLVSLAEASAHLAQGTVDVQVGLQKTLERERAMDFGEVLYVVRTVAIMRVEDSPDFRTIHDMVGLGPRCKILSIEGTGIAQILGNIPGINLDSSSKSVREALERLGNGEGRVLIYHNLSVFYIIQSPEFVSRFRTVNLDYSSQPLLVDSPQYLVFSKRVPLPIQDYLNGIVRLVREDGSLERITASYLY